MSITNSEDKFVTGKVLKEKFGISSGALRIWGDQGKIKILRTPGNTRLYNYPDCVKLLNYTTSLESKTKICYCRVSSSHQKEDLQRQVEYLKLHYPNHVIITDVGSGLNWERNGLRTILRQSLEGSVSEIVITYKDRLCRFGYDILEFILKTVGVKLLVHSETCKDKNQENTPPGELESDLLAIITTFVARNNGKRSATYKKQRKEASENKVEKQEK